MAFRLFYCLYDPVNGSRDPYTYENMSLFYSFDDLENPNAYEVFDMKLDDEVNKNAVLSFSFYSTHPLYSYVKKYLTYFLLAEEDDCLFFGRVTDLVGDYNNKIDITCEGYFNVLYSFIVCRDTYYKYSWENWDNYSGTVDDIISDVRTDFLNNTLVINGGYFYLNYIDPEYGQYEYSFKDCGDKSFGEFLFSTLIGETGGLIMMSVNGSYYSYPKEYRISQLYLNYYGSLDGLIAVPGSGGAIIPDFEEIEEDNPNHADEMEEQSFKFGLNLLDVKKEYPVDNIYTGVQTTCYFESEDATRYWITDVYYNDDALETFGSSVAVVDTQDSSEELAISHAEQIAQAFCGVYPWKYTIKGVDPHFIDPQFARIKIGDAVNCYSAPHGINKVQQCLKYSIDFSDLSNSEYVIGPYIPGNNVEGNLTTYQKRYLETHKF